MPQHSDVSSICQKGSGCTLAFRTSYLCESGFSNLLSIETKWVAPGPMKYCNVRVSTQSRSAHKLFGRSQTNAKESYCVKLWSSRFALSTALSLPQFDVRAWVAGSKSTRSSVGPAQGKIGNRCSERNLISRRHTCWRISGVES